MWKKALVLVFLFALGSGAAVFAQTADVKIAFLLVDNINKDPRYDYLAGMISGILLYDLSQTEGITLVDRGSLDEVLKEQALMLSDLSATEEVRVGRLIGARFLLKAGFVFLGDEVMVNLSIIDVESAKTTVLSQRGRTENLIHALAEDALLRLTGREIVFQADSSERSIISLKDEKPGSLSLYCNLVRAEILLDNEFAGYTTGDAVIPFNIDKLSPGKHALRIRLYGFGEIQEPEIIFKDWERLVEIQSGKNLVVRAAPAFYNTRVGELMTVYDKKTNLSLQKGQKSFEDSQTFSYTNRSKQEIKVELLVKVGVDEKQLVATVTLKVAGKSYTFTDSRLAGGNDTKEFEAGPVSLKTELVYYSASSQLVRVTVARADLDYDMWKTK